MGDLTPERWEQIGKAFEEALSLSHADQEAYLEKLKAEDPQMAREVVSLLATLERSHAFLEDPIGPKMAEALFSETLHFAPGARVANFEILRELGSGSFGTVYLARDLTLQREVAVKISPDAGDEARTLASLEHENIVMIFSETVDSKSQLRFICMQYVAGQNLDQLIRSLPADGTLDGPTLLRLAAQGVPATELTDRAALSDRDLLQKLDGVQCVLWLGKTLSRALAHAHQRGVLHLDVKPGNILIGLYGKPYLADFNISLNQRLRREGPQLLGGTVDYMAPEQAEYVACGPKESQMLDGRADIFSLGVVLKRLWTRVDKKLLDATEARRIEAIWDRATAPDRTQRFLSCEDFANALSNALDQHEMLRRLPRMQGLSRFFCRHPIAGIFLFTLIPQILGSVVNISYNALRIVSHLSVRQQHLFQRSLYLYNPLLYGICIVALLIPLAPLYRFAKEPEKPRTPDEFQWLRWRALNYPLWVAGVTTVGWTGGALVFPLTLHLFAGGLAPSVFFHFFISFLLSWLIALSYAFLFDQYIAVRALYPKLWDASSFSTGRAASELKAIERRTQWFRLGTGGIPLIAVALLIFVGPESFDPGTYAIYRGLVAALNAMGLVGFFISLRVTRELLETLFALEGN